MNALNADLHCHSTASDGTLSPAEVVRRAHANGVDLLALTDHDELLGIADAAAAADIGLRFVPGSRYRCRGWTRPCTSSAWGRSGQPGADLGPGPGARRP
jgi:predicted metal-dependent phosphoesterase TrpH